MTSQAAATPMETQVFNDTSSAEIRLSELAKSFGTRQVLKGCNMTVNPGEFLAIVGRSGCGKSTLLLLIARLDKLDAGHIAIGQMPARERSHQVRMMFQDARLLPWQSVLRNLGIGATGDWKP